mmetsp:Transcript_11336/g.30936  ORF Transcript_11336/g.30936 Transcript_11336/m.30936 type:complete len:276 (+) Transcript_11336:771-1598(+)
MRACEAHGQVPRLARMLTCKVLLQHGLGTLRGPRVDVVMLVRLAGGGAQEPALLMADLCQEWGGRLAELRGVAARARAHGAVALPLRIVEAQGVQVYTVRLGGARGAKDLVLVVCAMRNVDAKAVGSIFALHADPFHHVEVVFSHAHGPVARLPQELHVRRAPPGQEVLRVVGDPHGVRAAARGERAPGGNAERRRGVRIVEADALGRQGAQPGQGHVALVVEACPIPAPLVQDDVQDVRLHAARTPPGSIRGLRSGCLQHGEAVGVPIVRRPRA